MQQQLEKPMPPHVTERHCEVITANARNWLRADYEMINAALDIEINPEMSPMRCCKLVHTRLQAMSKRERQLIPNVIWSYLDALDVRGDGFHQYNPATPVAGQENHGDWFSVEHIDRWHFAVRPRKLKPVAFLQALRKRGRFKAWEAAHGVRCQVRQETVEISAPILDELSPGFVKTILSDM